MASRCFDERAVFEDNGQGIFTVQPNHRSDAFSEQIVCHYKILVDLLIELCEFLGAARQISRLVPNRREVLFRHGMDGDSIALLYSGTLEGAGRTFSVGRQQ